MENKDIILGLHHVTALSSPVQENVDFYAGILGLRLVKKTINFDDPGVYHLYYGDREGSPGTLLTFFPYPGISKGRKGNGQLTVTSFSIPADSVGYWTKRLEKFGIEHTQPNKRFENEEFIYFEDDQGLGLELVANDSDFREGYNYGHMPHEHSIKGFYSVTIAQPGHEKTAAFLETKLGHRLIAEKNGRFRYSVDGGSGGLVDVIVQPSGEAGRGGSGTVHHVAFAVADENDQALVRERLMNAGVHVTPVTDRQYFKSIYFREPGGVLFEVATNLPGMTIDEDAENLGGELKLPPWHEPGRDIIEKRLGEITFAPDRFRD